MALLLHIAAMVLFADPCSVLAFAPRRAATSSASYHMAAEPEASVERVPLIDSAEAVALFGRLAEKAIYMDPNVGACCHSACSDCEWRKPDGGYRFDVMRSGRPKWFPSYTRRDFEDERGSHECQWGTVFEGSDALEKDDFFMRLRALKFSMPLGPAGFMTGQPEVSDDILGRFWDALCRASGAEDVITAADVTAAIREWSTQEDVDEERGPDFASWEDFLAALRAV